MLSTIMPESSKQTSQCPVVIGELTSTREYPESSLNQTIKSFIVLYFSSDGMTVHSHSYMPFDNTSTLHCILNSQPSMVTPITLILLHHNQVLLHRFPLSPLLGLILLQPAAPRHYYYRRYRGIVSLYPLQSYGM